MTKQNIPYFRHFQSGFRKLDVQVIKNAVLKKKNLQFVGAKGSGKSLIFRAIKEMKVLGGIEIFLVDFNLIPEKSSLSVLNLIWGSMNNWESHDKLTEGEIIVKIQNKFNQIENSNKKVLFLFDSFENLAQVDNGFLFKSLASLLDQNRDLVTCIFSLEKEISDKILGTFSDIYNVPNLSKSDFDWFIKGFGKINSKDTELIYKWSGGFMGVAKRLFEIAVDGKLANAIKNPSSFIHLRYQLDLLIESGTNLDIPILKNYSPPKQDFALQNADNLTASEYKLFNYLKINEQKLCSRDDIITEIWGNNADRAISDHALDQLVHRLKKKLDKTGMKIVTVRGRGYKLLV